MRMKLIKRSLSDVVDRASRCFKCVMVSGPRQVGKTTLLKSMAEAGRRIVTLDDPVQRAFAQRDPELFLSSNPAPLLIDEVQYAPELFPYIKMRVDAAEATGQYWLTGSQPFRLMKGISESLAGRVAILDLQGLAVAEEEGLANVPYLPALTVRAGKEVWSRKEAAARIFRGSFPQLASVPDTDSTLFMSSYVATYLARDIRDLVKSSHEHEFMTFLTCLAARTGQLLNASNLAQDVGVSAPTISAWISILESSGIIVLLRPFRNNLTKRATATPKVYFTDTGLAVYLCGLRSADELERSQLFGHFFETFAIMSVLKSWWHAGLVCDASFYRDSGGHEIDLLIKDGAVMRPIEIKVTATPNVGEIESNIGALAKTGVGLGVGAVVCLTPAPSPLTRTLVAENISGVGI